jgi:hypothetical protein
MRRDEINVPVACGMDFEKMRAEGPKAVKRFCGDCKKHVHDLSRMSKAGARELLASESTEGLCVRYLYDERGNVVFAGDERLVKTNALTRMARAKRFVAAAATLALPMSLNACMGARVAPPSTSTLQQTTINPTPDPVPVADAGAPPTTTTTTTPIAK